MQNNPTQTPFPYHQALIYAETNSSVEYPLGSMGYYMGLEEEYIRLLTLLKTAGEALEKSNIALDRTLIYARHGGVWINSRVKGSAMWGIQDASKEIQESFAESGRLNDEASEAITKALQQLKDAGVL